MYELTEEIVPLEMTTFCTQNNVVACTPLDTTELKTEVRSGMARIETKAGITPLKVVYTDSERTYLIGDTVYVYTQMSQHPWAKNTLEVEKDVKFILVPKDQILILKRTYQGIGNPVVTGVVSNG